MAISQQALAAKLKISQMTVCRALRGDKCVTPELRQRVIAAAQRHGYPVAARFRRNRTAIRHVVCSIVNIQSIQAGRHGSDFNARLLAGIRQGIQEAGAQLMNFDAPPAEWVQAPDRTTDWPLIVARREVDGVVHLFGGNELHRPRYACPVPHVSIFCPIDDTSDTATVDNLGAGRAIGDHLGKLGHRRVAFIGPVTPLARDRLLGLRDGLVTHGGTVPDTLARQQANLGGDAEEIRTLLDALLPSSPCDPAMVRARFTAIAAYNDYMAASIVTELGRRGLRVPEDISVTGFDNVRPTDYQGPALTSAEIPLEALGLEAARLLYWRMDFPGAPRRTLTLDVPLIRGETAGEVSRED